MAHHFLEAQKATSLSTARPRASYPVIRKRYRDTDVSYAVTSVRYSATLSATLLPELTSWQVSQWAQRWSWSGRTIKSKTYGCLSYFWDGLTKALEYQDHVVHGWRSSINQNPEGKDEKEDAGNQLPSLCERKLPSGLRQNKEHRAFRCPLYPLRACTA